MVRLNLDLDHNFKTLKINCILGDCSISENIIELIIDEYKQIS